MARKDELGRYGEDCAALYLRECGFEVVARNWRSARGELDLIAIDTETLVIVEVKTRSTLQFGHPFEAINDAKRRRLRQLATQYAAEHPEWARHRNLRVDAIAVVGSERDSASLEHLVGVA